MKARSSFIAVSFFAAFAAFLMGHPGAAAASTLGDVIMNLQFNTSYAKWLFSAAAYMIGLILGVMAIVKLKQHVENPSQVPAWEYVKRILAGGAFFSLPFMIDVARTTIEGSWGASGLYSNSGFNGSASKGGLDSMIISLMSDVFIPLQWIFGWFGYLAGIILVMIGISRLLKSEQDGPRGPSGIGTVMTFIIAGCLFSLNAIIAYFTTTLFGDSQLQTSGVLQYTDGLGSSVSHVHAVISSIIAFAIVIGWVSIIRGLFIVRGVSEGNSQASMMAALSHLIGGTLAVNLGSIINAVQDTLGITKYGIMFN